MELNPNNKRRKIDLVTISKRNSPESQFISEIDELKKEFENYQIVDDSKNDQLIYAQNSIRKYIKKFGQIIANDCDIYEKNMKCLVEIINNIKNDNNSFLKQKQFSNLLDSFYDDLINKTNDSSAANSKDIAIKLNNDLLIELKRINLSKITDINDEYLAKKIHKLTKNLQILQKAIKKFQTIEITTDNMNEHSAFTQLPRLKRQAIRIWQKREQLLNRSISTGSYLYHKFSYNELKNEKMNRIIEDYFNQYLQSLCINEQKLLSNKSRKRKQNDDVFKIFDIIELKEHLLSKINEYKINFDLNDEMLTKIYEYLLNEMNKRREHVFIECLDNYSIVDDYDNASDNDFNASINSNKILEEKLEKNSLDSKIKMETLINEYKEKDYEKNGKNYDNNNDSKSIGWDDNGDNFIEKDEDDEEEEDDEDEESETDGDDDIENVIKYD